MRGTGFAREGGHFFARGVAQTILSRSLVVALVGMIMAQPSRGLACASCSCGDPTLTVMGAEQPFAGRLRASLEARYRGDAMGEPGVTEVTLRELRTDLALAYAPTRNLQLSLTAPLLLRQATYVNLGQDRVTSLGDVELRARTLLFRDRNFAPRHLVELRAGLKVPTAPQLHNDQDQALSSNVQPGTGSFDPLLGLSYAHFRAPWSGYVSLIGALPLGGYDGMTPGASLKSTLAVQYQPLNLLSFRAGLDSRLDGVSTQHGLAEPDTGGFISFATAGLLLSPTQDLVVHAGVAWPVVQALLGYHRETPLASIGVTRDF